MNEIARAGRAAARRLAAEGGPDVRLEVEKALTQRDQQKYLDPLSLGSLIVSVATLAWTVIKDLSKGDQAPSVEQVTRQVRIELTATDHVATAETHNKIINIVVSEIIKTDRP
jgi:hypothetical protein